MSLCEIRWAYDSGRPERHSRSHCCSRPGAFVRCAGICHNEGVSLIPESMAFALPDRAKTLNVLETLAIGAAGGTLFLWAHLPGGLISGAMIAVGVAAIAGRPLQMPAIMTQTVLVLLGISLGSLMSRQMLQHIGAYPVTIALLAAEIVPSASMPVPVTLPVSEFEPNDFDTS